MFLTNCLKSNALIFYLCTKKITLIKSFNKKYTTQFTLYKNNHLRKNGAFLFIVTEKRKKKVYIEMTLYILITFPLLFHNDRRSF